jgi:hypothetical protein
VLTQCIGVQCSSDQLCERAAITATANATVFTATAEYANESCTTTGHYSVLTATATAIATAAVCLLLCVTITMHYRHQQHCLGWR